MLACIPLSGHRFCHLYGHRHQSSQCCQHIWKTNRHRGVQWEDIHGHDMGSNCAHAHGGIGVDLRVLRRPEEAGHVCEGGQGGKTVSGGVTDMPQSKDEPSGFTIKHVCFCCLTLLNARVAVCFSCMIPQGAGDIGYSKLFLDKKIERSAMRPILSLCHVRCLQFSPENGCASITSH